MDPVKPKSVAIRKRKCAFVNSETNPRHQISRETTRTANQSSEYPRRNRQMNSDTVARIRRMKMNKLSFFFIVVT